MKIVKKFQKQMGRAAFSAAILASAALAHTQGAPDFSKVEITTAKLADNFYVLEGRGGAIGVLTGPDGILMVDGEFAPLTPKIVAAIKQFSNEPIRYLVDTHDHGDHTGGNENFAKMGAVILARDEVRERLMHPRPGANGAPGTPPPAARCPRSPTRDTCSFTSTERTCNLFKCHPATPITIRLYIFRMPM